MNLPEASIVLQGLFARYFFTVTTRKNGIPRA